MTLELNTRLNADLRRAIKTKALETSGLIDAEKPLIEKRAAFAEKVRLAALAACGTSDAALDSLWDSFNENHKMINGASNSSENSVGKYLTGGISRERGLSVDVTINGQYRCFSLNGSANGGDTHIVKELNGLWRPYYRVMLADEALLSEVMILDKETQELKDKEATFHATLDAVLNSARTVKQLLTAWPDAKELLPDDMQKATSTALAIDPTALNALCGIPTNK